MDVLVQTDFSVPPERVARIMFDPRRDPEWIGGARSVDLLTSEPTAVGARTRRHGGFLGRRFSWVTEVTEHEPDALLRMKFVEGPMKGEVTYTIESAPGGSRACRFATRASRASTCPEWRGCCGARLPAISSG